MTKGHFSGLTSVHYAMEKITDFGRLDAVLGNEFILFCGSAVSGANMISNEKWEPFLPMVWEASEKFFLNLYRQVDSSHYLNNLTGNLAKELATGKYVQIRQRTKFEEFIRRIEVVLGNTPTEELLKSLFLCEANQCTHNHLAIANLIDAGRAQACFTTNFDNGVEIAFPSINKIVHVNNTSLTKVPNKTLLKLHGDVTTGVFIATVPELIRAEQFKVFDYLINLLGGKTVLFLGYSGIGDIDIAPTIQKLANHNSKLVWFVKKGEKPPPFATHWFESNLYSLNNNWLIKLASRYGKIAPSGGKGPDWESRLNHWFNKFIDLDSAVQLLTEFFEGKASWPILKLVKSQDWTSRVKNTGFNPNESNYKLGKAYSYVGAYYSSLKTFSKINTQVNFNEIQKANLALWKGFSYWRLMKFEKSIDELTYFTLVNKNLPSQLAIRGLRTYLDVINDYFLSNKKVLARYTDSDLNEIKTLSEALSGIKDFYYEEDIILSSLTIIETKLILSENVNTTEIEDVYSRAQALMLWTAATKAARIITRLDPNKGRSMLKAMYKENNSGFRWHSIKHDLLIQLISDNQTVTRIRHIIALIITIVPVIGREIDLSFRTLLWYVEFMLRKKN